MNRMINQRVILKFAAVMTALLAVTASVFSLQNFNDLHHLTIDGTNWNIHKLHNLIPVSNQGRMMFTIQQNQTGNNPDMDLYINFESETPSISNYQTIRSKYHLNNIQKINGKTSGKFYVPGDVLSLQPLPGSILIPGRKVGSITIEFWTYFYKSYDNQMIMKYKGENLSDIEDMNRYGIEIFTKDHHIIYRFENFFRDEEGRTFTVEVSEESAFSLQQWEHHAVTFNITDGKMTSFKNGVQQEEKWITKSGTPYSEIYNSFVKQELSTTLLIGKNGFFSIDNFLISGRSYSDFQLNRFRNDRFSMTTDIYYLSENLCELRSLEFTSQVPEFSFMKYAYRFSEQYFLPENQSVPWIYFDSSISNFPSSHLKGKFIQFKVEGYPYENNTEPILIHSAKLEYSVDRPPKAPIIKDVQPQNQSAVISWIPTPEPDIIGYEIYYGNEESFYINSDALQGASPIFVPYENSSEKLEPIEYRLTGLQNDKPYFLSICSVDQNGHRGGYSDEIYFRPSTVYSGTGYFIDK